MIQKSHKVPSGATWLFREFATTRVIEVMQEEGATEKDFENEKAIEDFLKGKQVNLIKILKIALSECVVKPRIVLEDTNNEDELNFYDASNADRLDAFKFILSISGLTAEGAAQQDFLRKEHSRNNGRTVKPELRAKTN